MRMNTKMDGNSGGGESFSTTSSSSNTTTTSNTATTGNSSTNVESTSLSTTTNNTAVKRRPKIEFDFDAKIIASSQDDLDLGLLRVQNRRLCERLQQRQRIEQDLRSRIDQLEKKLLDKDTKMYVINRYWNQMNEEMRIILQRFEPCSEKSSTSSSSGTTSGSSKKSSTSTTAATASDNSRDGGGGSGERKSSRKLTTSSSSDKNDDEMMVDDDDDDDDDNNDNDDDDRGTNDSDDSDDSITVLDSARRPTTDVTTSFIRQLGNWDKEELEETLQQQVALSTTAISKVLLAVDRVVNLNEKVLQAIKQATTTGYDESANSIKDGDDNGGGDGTGSGTGGGTAATSATGAGGGTTAGTTDETGGDDQATIRSPGPDDAHGSGGKNRRHAPIPVIAVDNALKELIEESTRLYKNAHQMFTSLHEKCHRVTLENAELHDKVQALELENDELKNRIDEVEFELNKSRTRERRFEEHFYEAREKLRELNAGGSGGGGNNGSSGGTGAGGDHSIPGFSQSKLDDLCRELEEAKELANSRLVELEQLNNEHKELLKKSEKLQLDLQCIPDSVIHESAEFKSLQSHFSVLYNEFAIVKQQLEERTTQLNNAKTAHLRQIEQMEAEELTVQKRIRTEHLALEEALSKLKKNHELLSMDYEQLRASTEQQSPVNREQHHMMQSLQTHVQQLKADVERLRKKLKSSSLEVLRQKQIIEEHGLRLVSGGLLIPDSKVGVPPGSSTPHQHQQQQQQQQQQQLGGGNHNALVAQIQPQPSSSSSSIINMDKSAAMIHADDSSNDGTLVIATKEEADEMMMRKDIKSEPLSPTIIKKEDTSDLETASTTTAGAATSGSSAPELGNSTTSMDTDQKPPLQTSSQHSQSTTTCSHCSYARAKLEECERTIRDLRRELKKSQEAQRELKLLLDVSTKSTSKETRDKATLIASEKRLKFELEESRALVRKLQELITERRGDRRKWTEEEFGRKVAKYEEVINNLQRQVCSLKSEEDALLNEMEVTGSAYEDMQEQNSRLIQQLREKDDANLKIISERIKLNEIQKLLKEEKEMLTEHIISLQTQVESQNSVVRKLEEKERILTANLATMEKELTIRQQAMEFHKRKAIETSQQCADLKLHMEKYINQIRDAQSIVADKTSAWQQEMFKNKRLQEEINLYKKKYERAKKFELANTADEVLQEEIRELKEELTCPSCKTKRKDAVLNKCFHVFCYDCLKTRYDTRQRKCPKCNQSFAANDFHRLYLA